MEIIETSRGYRIVYFDEGIREEYYEIGGSEIHVFKMEIYLNYHFIRIGQYKRRLTYQTIVWVADDISGKPFYWTSGQYFISLGRRSKVIAVGKLPYNPPKTVIDLQKKFIPSFTVTTPYAYIHVKNLENIGNVYRIKAYTTLPENW